LIVDVAASSAVSSPPPKADANAPRSHGAVFALACLTLAAILGYSLLLALVRIYQVDEAQNVFMARQSALGQYARYFNNGYLFLLGPFAWLMRDAETSAEMFWRARCLFWVLYLANLVLVPFAAGVPWRSRRFVYATLLLASLGPLLDYGIEVRHDNLMLLLLLSYWSVLRRYRGPPLLGWAVLGVLVTLLQFAAFKSFLYWLPLSLAVLVFPPPNLRASLLGRAAAWCVGLLMALGCVRLLYGNAGAWQAYVEGVRIAFRFSGNAERFAPYNAFLRVLLQSPVVCLGFVVLALRTARELGQRRFAALSWDGSLPELGLCALSTAAFLSNPAPYPYNLLHWLPFFALWLLRAIELHGAHWLLPRALPGRARLAVLVVLGCLHFSAFAYFAERHLSFRNERQRLLMTTAEALTDARTDRVFDASGLIAARESIGYQFFLHSLVMRQFKEGELRQRLLEAAPAVVLRNYRTDWMRPEEQNFLMRHYVLLSDDCLVLGGVSPPAGGPFQSLRSGRYSVRLLGQRGGELRVNGQLLQSPAIVELPRGAVQIGTPSEVRAQIAWLGPSLTRIPVLPKADHLALFVNWY